MGWKENQKAYIKSYLKEEYHRITISIRKNGSEQDRALWEAIENAPSKVKAIKELAYKGLNK